MTDAKTTQISRLVTIAVFLVLLSFSGTSLALTQSAFGYNVSAAGDWGCSDNTRKTVSSMISKNPERVLGLGDYSYSSTADCWLAIVDPLDEKMRISIGNHDDYSSTLLNQYMSHFDLSRQYYSFNYQNTHFVVLSTEQVSSYSQYVFARVDLATASSNANIDWIIVYMHKPLYTSPGIHPGESTMRDRYHPLFDRYGVDIVLYGHNHAYERSYPIEYDSEGNPATPIVTTRETRNYNDPEGQIFATVGTAGRSIYPYFSKSSYIVTQYEDYGFLDINIVENRLVAKFYSNNDGLVKDQFTITKDET
ncbi:MAG TPA: metallophosphoesterase [Nitrososphaeraceae archaeon]|nr:metallophosphoesterase [Nitrososphaeraceae archaeon]